MKNIVIASIIGIAAMALAAQPGATSKPVGKQTSQPTTKPTSQPVVVFDETRTIPKGTIGELPKKSMIIDIEKRSKFMTVAIQTPSKSSFCIKMPTRADLKVGDEFTVAGPYKIIGCHWTKFSDTKEVLSCEITFVDEARAKAD